MLLGARPLKVIFTVNAWLLGSQLRVAIPFGTCFSVALAVVALAVGVDVVEDGGVGGVAEPPQEARSQTKAMLSNAKLEAVRLINYEYLSSIISTITILRLTQPGDAWQRLTLLQ